MTQNTLSNIYILGAGSMGCLWATHLNKAYPNLISFLSTRPDSSVKPIKFELETSFNDSPTSSIEIPLDHATNISSIDLLLVCTKSYDAMPALEGLKSKLSDQSKIVLFQNGLGSQFEVIKAFPNTPIYAAVTTEGANRASATKIIHAGSGHTYIGALNDAANQCSGLDECFKTVDLQVSIEKDIWRRLWNKLAINCAINPFTAILDCPNGEVRSSRLFKSKWPGLLEELNQLLQLAGYSIEDSELESAVFDVMDKTGQNISSMLQDVRKHKRTEIDDINGFAHRYLIERGQDSMTNKALLDAVNGIKTSEIRN